MSENFHRFWKLRGGPEAFERWRLTGEIPKLRVRVSAPEFVAWFEITDRVIAAEPVLYPHLMGLSESEARAKIKRMGWTAAVVRLT